MAANARAALSRTGAGAGWCVVVVVLALLFGIDPVVALPMAEGSAQFNFGTMYVPGTGVEASEVKAASWCVEAAKQGHDAAIVRMKALSAARPSPPDCAGFR